MNTTKILAILLKKLCFRPDGKTIWYLDEYDKKYRNNVKYIEYHPDGKTIKEIREYDYYEELIKITYYDPDGTISDIINF
ncbi:hypothetical protein RS022_02260 [Candidatus Phytoplasma rubi]|uniref:DUF2963 domain-containing protein n=1 Tax=Candidatus Phytoplasma rubi TaxID=399025 RepID=A0ABY7BTK8_9MOLU|nr:DUF2963 domain-containing protein [Candidatus Phytoplasma rubi]WAN63191.1 hypothetical protein RS022_02260 [Candidatus Phytoplasma rubi]